MDLPEWLPWVAAGVAIIAWRRVVLGWLRAGRLGQHGAAAVYAAIIPVFVLIAFAVAGRLDATAFVYAAIGFGLSYGFARLVFRRAELIKF